MDFTRRIKSFRTRTLFFHIFIKKIPEKKKDTEGTSNQDPRCCIQGLIGMHYFFLRLRLEERKKKVKKINKHSYKKI